MIIKKTLSDVLIKYIYKFIQSDDVYYCTPSGYDKGTLTVSKSVIMFDP